MLDPTARRLEINTVIQRSKPLSLYVRSKIASYFGDDVESMKLKKWLSFLFREAEDHICDNDFEIKEDINVRNMCHLKQNSRRDHFHSSG